MLSDETLKALADDVTRHFGNADAQLVEAAHKMADAGWPKEEILPLLSLTYWAGYERGQGSADGIGD